MKIIIITPILFDKTSPFNHLMRDILQGFLDAGHHVTRIVAVEHIDDTEYQMGLNQITYIPVVRKRVDKASIIKRYLIDTLNNIKMANLLKKTKGDVLFEDVSYSSFWSVRTAKIKGMRIVCMLQDVWPDNAVQSGLMKDGGVIYRFFSIWQKKVYINSDSLICISDDMKAFLVSKGVIDRKVCVIYNWGYSDDIIDIPWEKNCFVKKYGLSKDKFYVVYAGNIGRMQNVELIVEAAEILQTRENIVFMIIGEGVRKKIIEDMVRNKKLRNVYILPLQPPRLAIDVYSAACINVVPLVTGGIKTAFPSKVGVLLSCERPIIFAFGHDSIFADLVEKFNIGSCVSPSNPEELAESVIAWSEREDNKNYSAIVFKEKFSKTVNVSKYIEALQIFDERM